MSKSPADPLNDPRFADVVEQLRRQPLPEPSDGWEDRVMAGLRQVRPVARTFRVWQAAASLAILLGALYILYIPGHRDTAKMDRRPLDILMAAQRADGGWSADVRNERSRYDTGVTALALLALLRTDETVSEGALSPAIHAGVAHLLQQQDPQGRFGADASGARFTQYLATQVLELAVRRPDVEASWKTALSRARIHLPAEIQMAQLNRHLAHPESFPARWAEAGGPSAMAAIRMLNR